MEELLRVSEKNLILCKFPRRYQPFTKFSIVLDSEQLPRRDIANCCVLNDRVKIICVGEGSITFVSSGPELKEIIELGPRHRTAPI